MKKPKVLVNFKASPELVEVIREQAKRTKRPVSAYIRAILEMVLMDNEEVAS